MMRTKTINAPPAPTTVALRHATWLLLILVGVIAAVAVVLHASLPWSDSSVEWSHTVTRAVEPTEFAPTVPNSLAVPASSPAGMVWISGGEFSMGAMDPPATDEVAMHGAEDARPIH